MGVTANSTDFTYRTTDSGNTTQYSMEELSVPQWIRMVREGARYDGYVSEDGVYWTLVNSTTLSLGDSAEVCVWHLHLKKNHQIVSRCSAV
jgi:hypothetical protein